MLATQIQALITRKPFLREILDAFSRVLMEGVRVRGDLDAKLLPPSNVGSSSRLSEGFPLLSTLQPGIKNEELRPGLKKMLNALAVSFPPLGPDMDRLAAYLDSDSAVPAAWLEMIVLKDENRMKQSAEELGVQVETFQFALEQALKPVLQWLAGNLSHYMEEINWDRGYCPVCGGFPDTSCLRKPPNDPGAYLMAHGGQRWLHCSRCSHEWRLHRVICPWCGNEDSDSLEYLSAKEAAHEKLYVCHKCNRFLTCMDASELIEAPVTDLIPFELLHLEVMANGAG